jgi:starch synthase
VGGLDDVVKGYDASAGEGNGFTFFDPTPEAFGDAIDRALTCFRNKKEDWARIVRNGMSGDFSWERSARQYFDLYQHAIKLKHAGAAISQKKVCGQFCVQGV